MKIFGTITLLFFSNLFMTYAWYGHLKRTDMALGTVILISWGVAFFEYCLQVPANRIGHTIFTAPQLKLIQEVITFVVFYFFSVYYLKEIPTWNDRVAILLVIAAAFVGLYKPVSL